jgi:hypothetical protein
MNDIEKLKILAGIKENIEVENELEKYFENEKIIKEQQEIREQNETKNVFTHFDEFEKEIQLWEQKLNIITKIFNENNKKILFNGLLENKFDSIKKLIDIVLVDGIYEGMNYLDTNFNLIKQEIDKMEFITENMNENELPVYYSKFEIDTNENEYGIDIKVYSDKLFENEIDNFKIEFGSQFSLINSNTILLKQDGKKYYLKIKENDLKKMFEEHILV